MLLLWPSWLVFCCFAVLVAVFKPQSAAIKPLAVVVVLGALTFFVWLTNGRFAAFAVLGFALAHPVLLVIVVRHTGVYKVPAPLLRIAATRLLVPALVLGGLIGAGIEFGGRWSGSTFVVWRACIGGTLIFAAGITFFIRATKQRPPELPARGTKAETE